MTSIELFESQLAWPTDWDAHFGRQAPLLVEIGFGNGQFLVNLAQKRPSANLIGVEISAPSVRRAVKKLTTQQLTNVRVLQADARLVLQLLCAPGVIDGVTINFPDPWPKEKHHERRLIQPAFLHLLATRMPSGATLDIATDHDEYAAAITACLTQTPYFDSRLDKPFVTTDETRQRTKYEETARREGRLCRYYKWVRNETAAPNIFPILEESPMPHAVIATPLTLDEIGARFTPQTFTEDPIHVRLLAAYQATQDPQLLVEAYLQEDPLRQRLAFVIRRRDSGDFVIDLHEIGFPRVTPGVQVAVAHLARWLLDLHPQAALLHTDLRPDLRPA